MVAILAWIVNLAANLIILLVIVDSVLSFILSPYHPVRSALDRIVQPMLAPIRRVVPLVGAFDLSPLILIILIEILSYALVNFLYVL